MARHRGNRGSGGEYNLNHEWTRMKTNSLRVQSQRRAIYRRQRRGEVEEHPGDSMRNGLGIGNEPASPHPICKSNNVTIIGPTQGPRTWLCIAKILPPCLTSGPPGPSNHGTTPNLCATNETISSAGQRLALRRAFRLHPHRASPSHRDHCDPSGAVAAGTEQSQVQRTINASKSNLKQISLGLSAYLGDFAKYPSMKIRLHPNPRG